MCVHIKIKYFRQCIIIYTISNFRNKRWHICIYKYVIVTVSCISGKPLLPMLYLEQTIYYLQCIPLFLSLVSVICDTYCIAGNLAVWRYALIKICQTFLRVHVRMAIPYHTAKFKSTNGVKNIDWGQTAKFNDCQYFRLYGIPDSAITELFC